MSVFPCLNLLMRQKFMFNHVNTHPGLVHTGPITSCNTWTLLLFTNEDNYSVKDAPHGAKAGI